MNIIKLNYTVKNDDFLNMGHVSGDVRKKLKEMNYSPEIIRRVSTALYQGEINMLIHAGGGQINIEINDKCIITTLSDKGPGIENIEEALADGYSTANEHAKSLGFGEGTGFSAMKKFSDEMEIYSEPGVGTTLIMKVFINQEIGNVNLKTITIEDYDAVYSLWLSCAGMGLNNLDDSREGIDKFLKRNPGTCFAAEKNGEIVGAIIVGNDGRRGYIYHTAVHPEYRNQGIGTALAEKAMNALKELGIHKAALVVFERNKNGNDFWEKLGFTVRNDLVYRNRTITETTRIDT